MTQSPILPILLPLIGGLVVLAMRKFGIQAQRTVGLVLTGALVLVGLHSLSLASQGATLVYNLGNWPAPFGIVIALDRLSAMMTLLTAVLALAALSYAALSKTDERGPHFHVLIQFQLFGLNGAFLTGDVFNLFVFFEVLLLASYGLMLHGSGPERTRAGLHYVVINLVGSTLFLFAVGALYGALGTLNIADMAQKIASAPEERNGLITAAGLLLLVVFGLKAAIFPLYLWLPQAYSSATAPVAALFAIMTKVGIYSIVRVHGTLFGDLADELAQIHIPWLLAGGLATLLFAALGVAAARRLREQVSYIVLASVATLLVAVGLDQPESLAAGLYYLIHSTLLAAAFFILADLIKRHRGQAGDGFDTPSPIQRREALGAAFFLAAVALAGLPPFSGFVGKIMILDTAMDHPWRWAVLAIVLSASLLIIVSLARTGSFLFFRPLGLTGTAATPPTLSGSTSGIWIVSGLLAVAPLLALFAGPVMAFTTDTVSQLQQTSVYIETVLENPTVNDASPKK